jgi:hypothetical protein
MDDYSERTAELLALFDDSGITVIVKNLITEMVFMESELENLRKMPMILCNKKGITAQSAASKQYIALTARYSDIVGKLTSALRKNENEEDSPLRAYMKSLEV